MTPKRRPTHPRASVAATVNLILLEPGQVVNRRAVLGGVQAAHVRSVLRSTPGSTVRIGVIDGPFGIGTVRDLNDDGVVLDCALESDAPNRPRVDVLLALPRPKVLRRLWAQLAALGVGHIALTNAARVERHYFDAHVLEGHVYRPLLLEGLQQARDTRLPTVSIHRQLKVHVEDELGPIGEGVRILGDPGATHSVATAIAAAGPGRVLVAIGPEGGWTDFERRLLEGHGFSGVSLGPRTLRTDTATIALLSLVHSSLPT